ncbi:MAG: hypothetical protein KDH20_09520 [Rhodocyclaceae bacterium]|nr:hypothetical protein [Rhodocyclaceae bacterium]
MTDGKKYGPFVHKLNKGGLHAIVTTGKLRGAEGSNYFSNDRAAVRAYVGTFEYQKKNKNWSGRTSIFIEFMTTVPLRSGLGPGHAEWSGDELIEGYLPIQILRVLNGEGEAVPV